MKLFGFPPHSPAGRPAPPPDTNGHFSVPPSMKLLVAHPLAELAPPTLGASSRFRLRHAMSNPRGHGVTEPESWFRPLCDRWSFAIHPRRQQNITILARCFEDNTDNGVRTAPRPSDNIPRPPQRGRGPGPPWARVELPKNGQHRTSSYEAIDGGSGPPPPAWPAPPPAPPPAPAVRRRGAGADP